MGLNFYLLGPPYVTWNDSVLDIPRRQVRKLLYYLASYPNAVPQERLHYLFWNDKSEAECRRNLSHLLTHARSSLPEKEVLIVKDSLIMLDPQGIWCDVVEFKKLIQSPLKDSRSMDFKQAAKYYRGPFLDGLQFVEETEFENLIELERFNLERNYLNLLYKMLLTEKQDGNYESAINYGYQYLAIDNLSEEVHRQLIMLHGLTGNRERAMSQFRICEELVGRELQAKPSMKTRLIYQQVLADASLSDDSRLLSQTMEIRPVKIDPLVFNSTSYSRFANLLDETRQSGHGGVAMLFGELGIGKSGLLTKSLSVFGRDRLIVRVRCDPGVRSLSYWPIKTLLLKEFKPHSSIRTMLSDFSQAGQTSEETSHEGTKNITPDATTKDKFFTSLVNSIVSLADEPGGLIFCVEDLEWADADTLDLFLYLCRYTLQKKIWLIGTYCCPENDNLVKFLSNLEMVEGYLGSVKVQGLDEGEIDHMIKIWLGNLKVEPAFIRQLHRLSGGNPFFISEILRWITETGIPIDHLMGNNPFSLPPTITKAINFRLSRLSRTEMRVLETGAVLGTTFKVDQISELADLSVMQVLDALDELVNHHFLYAHSSQYTFTHGLLRQAVLEGMSPARRQFIEGALGN